MASSRRAVNRTHSQTDSVSTLDDANTGTEPDLHDRSDATAHAAAVAQRQGGAGSGEQCTSGTRAQARQLPAVPDQKRSYAAAELNGHVAAVRDRDEHDPRIMAPVDAKTSECEAAHDVTGHNHPHADSEPHLHIDATTAQRTCRKKDEDLMVAGFRASELLHSECQDRALAWAER